MCIASIKYIFWRRRMKSPERLIDAVIADMKRRLTESRLQLLAADLARDRLSSSARGLIDASQESTARSALSELETILHELENKRNQLISRMHDADARLAIQTALMEADMEPSRIALEMIADRAVESESHADATSEVRRISNRRHDGE